MKTEFLKEFGLTQEQIDLVMAENGRDIESYKVKNEELESSIVIYKKSILDLKEDVSTREGQLSELKKINPKELEEKIKLLEEENKINKKQYDEKLTQERIKSEVDKVLRKYHCRNPKMLESFIDFKKITTSEDGAVIYGVEETIKPLLEDEETKFMFERDLKPIGNEPRDGMDNPLPLVNKKPHDMSYEEFTEAYYSKK